MDKIIGVNPVIEVLQNKEKTIEKLEIFKGAKDDKINKIKRLASERNIKIFYTDKKRENSQGVVVYVSDYDYYVDFGAFLEKIAPMEKAIVLILDEIQDPRNFGALIRSAEVFVKTSTGAIEYVDIVKVTNISDAISKLKKLDYWVYGAEGEGSKDYSQEKYPSRTALVLGSEGNGIRKKVKESCDILIKIPMYGKINSLNVSVAGGIILSEIVKSF